MLVQYVIQTIVSLLNISSVTFTRRGKPLGWFLVIVAQLIFAIYSAFTGQYFFIIMNIGMIVSAGVALKHILSEREL